MFCSAQYWGVWVNLLTHKNICKFTSSEVQCRIITNDVWMKFRSGVSLCNVSLRSKKCCETIKHIKHLYFVRQSLNYNYYFWVIPNSFRNLIRKRYWNKFSMTIKYYFNFIIIFFWTASSFISFTPRSNVFIIVVENNIVGTKI